MCPNMHLNDSCLLIKSRQVIDSLGKSNQKRVFKSRGIEFEAQKTLANSSVFVKILER